MMNRYGITTKSSIGKDGTIISNEVNPIAIDLDSYGQTSLADAIANIRSANPNGKYLQFAFLTDIHRGHNGDYAGIYAESEQTFKLMAELNKYCKFEFVGVGGDIINGYDNPMYYEENVDWIADKMNYYFKDLPICTTVGNHDKKYNSNVPLRTNEFLSKSFKKFIAANKDVTIIEDNNFKCNFAVDFTNYNVRLIFVNEWDGVDLLYSANGSFGGSNLCTNSWAKFITDDKKYIGSVSHGMGAYGSISSTIKSLIDLGQYNGKFIGNIVGHTHSYSIENNDTFVVGAAYDVLGYIGTRESVYCFSVFVIDTDNDEIIEIRVGRDSGVDRLPFYPHK